MRKLITYLIIAALLLGLCACGGSDSTPTSGEIPQIDPTTTPTPMGTPDTDVSGFLGTWTLESGITEGYEWTAAEEGVYSEIHIEVDGETIVMTYTAITGESVTVQPALCTDEEGWYLDTGDFVEPEYENTISLALRQYEPGVLEVERHFMLERLPACTIQYYVHSTVYDPVENYRMGLREMGCGLAVAYLGMYDMNLTPESVRHFLHYNGMMSTFSFMEDIPAERMVDVGGYELYLVIPPTDDTRVAVYDWILTEENDFVGQQGDTCYYSSETGEPFLLVCNYSDIMPNCVIRTEQPGIDPILYAPGLSGEDGQVIIPEFEPFGYRIMDLSWYSQWECAETEDVAGSWSVEVAQSMEDDAYCCYFEFKDDGTMRFGYGLYDWVNIRYDTQYVGKWRQVRQTEPGMPYCFYELELELAEGDGPEQLLTTQYIAKENDYLIFERVDGDMLYPNGYDDVVYLYRTMG